MNSETKFWNWFIKHEYEYKFLNSLNDDEKDRKLDQFLKELHKYNKDLYFQIGGDDLRTINELVISAEGNIRFFEKVRTLVNAAPVLKDWKVIAFKRPMPCGFKTRYEDILLETNEIWFSPLSNSKEPDSLGLEIYVPHYDPEDEKKFLAGMFQVLDTLLGEESCALNIQHVTIVDLANDPEELSLIKLCELPKYIEWKASKKR